MTPRGVRQVPVTDEERQHILALHAQGMTRNEICRETRRSSGTVSLTVADAGFTFARGPEVEAATAARKADLEGLRTREAYFCLLDAMRIREQMSQPAVVFSFGGKDNTYEERAVDEPPASDKRALASAASMLYDRSLKLCPPDAGSSDEQAGRDLITSLMAGLTAIHRDQQEATDEGA
ncbi:hypothetical protein B4N89_20605 [Embleya scabrispora]|uniref:Transposase IS30-like HTH domain-containing protein n=1 Tax=Embleya scabrispora TaxID=159449 RepID=A0A1T3P1M6_9ACTN|nr:helix-turn-helix domain-containing protein [Embleya scabrispora]OPC83016.1 hypothetical protein B4N89_20605 [Embleya scabrispora]